MPREWVLERIEGLAAESLDLSGYWEFRRLLELYELLDGQLLQRLVEMYAKLPRTSKHRSRQLLPLRFFSVAVCLLHSPAQ
jgi:hypothetical protein